MTWVDFAVAYVCVGLLATGGVARLAGKQDEEVSALRLGAMVLAWPLVLAGVLLIILGGLAALLGGCRRVR